MWRKKQIDDQCVHWPLSILGCLLAVVLGITVVAQTPRNDRACKPAQVKGTLTDITGAVVNDATLSFESPANAYKVKTGATGTYSMLLEPGTYTVSVAREGFCRIRRGAFVASPGSKIEFDFQLWVCPSDSFGSWNYVELDPAGQRNLRPLVLFGERKSLIALEIFTGPDLDRQYPAELTFNKLTVTAERMVYDRRNQTVTATGSVTWQVGGNAQRASRIEISLGSDEPGVKVTKTLELEH
jgi:hypothetical protein